MINEVLKFIVSLVGLCYGANLLVRGSGQIARAAGVSGLVVGLTVVSLATSAPELFISVIAALNGNADLAIGNVVGSNIANIGLVMALTAVVGRGLVFNKNVANRDCIVMVGATLLVFPLMWDLRLVRWEGGLLAILLFGYLFAVVRSANEDRRARNQPILWKINVNGGRKMVGIIGHSGLRRITPHWGFNAIKGLGQRDRNKIGGVGINHSTDDGFCRDILT